MVGTTIRRIYSYNFYLSYTGPLGGAGANKDIKVDICQDELIYNAPEKKQIINTLKKNMAYSATHSEK